MPPVFGFHSAQPVAAIYRHPFTGAVIATPVLDLSSVRGPQGYADRSGYGNWGVPVGAPANARGVFDEAIRVSGTRPSYVNCGSNATLDIVGDISAMCWVFTRSGLTQGAIVKTDGAAGWGLYTMAGVVTAFFYNGFLAVSGVSNILGRFSHSAMAVKSNVCRVFVDGLQEARAACVMGDAPASPLVTPFGTTWPLDGLIELPQVYNGALSPEQVYRNYLQARDVPIYYDTFESYAVTPVAKAVGSMCGPYRITGGSMLVVVDAAGRHWVQGSGGGQIDGTIQWPENNAYGTYEWIARKGAAAGYMAVSPIMSGRLPLFSAGQNGYMVYTETTNSVQFYRMTGAAPTLLFLTANGYVDNVSDYNFRVVRRIGGQTALYIKGGVYIDWTLVDASVAGTNPFVDNTYSAAPYEMLTMTDGASRISDIRFSRTCERPASFPWEFSTGTYAGLVSGPTVWMRCLTAGVTYLPKDLDWQTAIFGVYKGADANVLDIHFVATEIGGTGFATLNGYCLRVSADERLQLIRMSGGIETLIVETAAAFVSITTEYQLKITHNGTTNAYEFFILGGAYATWTAVTALSAVLGIYTSSNYTTFDLDADDRVTAPQFFTNLR
jgi:hypothetical protein